MPLPLLGSRTGHQPREFFLILCRFLVPTARELKSALSQTVTRTANGARKCRTELKWGVAIRWMWVYACNLISTWDDWTYFKGLPNTDYESPYTNPINCEAPTLHVVWEYASLIKTKKQADLREGTRRTRKTRTRGRNTAPGCTTFGTAPSMLGDNGETVTPSLIGSGTTRH